MTDLSLRALKPWGRVDSIGNDPSQLLIQMETFSAIVRVTALDHCLQNLSERLTSIGFPVPRVNSAVGEEPCVIWLSPRDFLILHKTHPAGDVIEKLNSIIKEDEALIIDQTHGLGILSYAGDRALDLLSQGTSLDFSEVSFGKGESRRTSFAHLKVTIFSFQATSTIGQNMWMMVFDAPYADYLSQWLLHAQKNIT
ncbi:MAG: hypothetical protein K9G26_05150 [Emcibacter sp.]|nr:hypothetical protein [Emcibacter sp.]